jgi:hypothetical protein
MPKKRVRRDEVAILRAAVLAEQLVSMTEPFIVDQCPRGAWRLLRGVTTEALLKALEHHANRYRNDYFLIHSIKEGTISRTILSASKEHIAELKQEYGEIPLSRRATYRRARGNGAGTGLDRFLGPGHASGQRIQQLRWVREYGPRWT